MGTGKDSWNTVLSSPSSTDWSMFGMSGAGDVLGMGPTVAIDGHSVILGTGRDMWGTDFSDSSFPDLSNVYLGLPSGISSVNYNDPGIADYLRQTRRLADDIGDKKRVTIELGNALEEFLLALHPGLLNIVEGARQALNSSNPDRVRHFTTSLRELFTHVLHELAPDHRVSAWSNSPANYDEKGRLKRRARLRYICRNAKEDRSPVSIEARITETLKLVDLFHRGTHGLEPKFSLGELSQLGGRMVDTLAFLYEMNGSRRSRNH